MRRGVRICRVKQTTCTQSKSYCLSAKWCQFNFLALPKTSRSNAGVSSVLPLRKNNNILQTWVWSAFLVQDPSPLNPLLNPHCSLLPPLNLFLPLSLFPILQSVYNISHALTLHLIFFVIASIFSYLSTDVSELSLSFGSVQCNNEVWCTGWFKKDGVKL